MSALGFSPPKPPKPSLVFLIDLKIILPVKTPFKLLATETTAMARAILRKVSSESFCSGREPQSPKPTRVVWIFPFPKAKGMGQAKPHLPELCCLSLSLSLLPLSPASLSLSLSLSAASLSLSLSLSLPLQCYKHGVCTGMCLGPPVTQGNQVYPMQIRLLFCLELEEAIRSLVSGETSNAQSQLVRMIIARRHLKACI